MTKIFKTTLSMLVVIAMLLGFMPCVLAKTDALTPDNIELFGNATFADGCDATILTDEYYHSGAELKKDGTGIAASTTDNGAISKVATFSAVDSGIEYSWNSDVSVKRLDLWILNCGGIDGYTVETSEDGEEWTPVVSGKSLDKWDGDHVTEVYQSLASYHPIIFDEPVTTSHLRFVIKSFADSDNPVAYISEAKVYNTNEINLGEQGYFAGFNDTYKGSNPYLVNYAASGSSNAGTYKAQSWPYYGGGGVQMVTPDADGNGIWYATTFGNSKVKVNEFRLNLSAGSVSQIDVWVAKNNDSTFLKRANTPTFTLSDSYKIKWTKVATIDCNITADSSPALDIPYAIEGAGIFFQVKSDKMGEGTKLKGIDMYSVADYELSPIAKAAECVFDEVITTDTDNMTEASKHIYGLDTTEFTVGNDTYTVTFSESSELLESDGRVNFHEDEETVTINARVSSGGEDGTAYYVSKTYILLPRENECIITIDGEDSEILADGFLFSAFDSQKEGITAEEALERFVKISNEETIIDYRWDVTNKSTRLETWVYPAGAIDEYEIQTSEDGVSYSTVKEGSLFENVSDEQTALEHASYYPILFDRQDTKYLRFIVKSFADGFDEAYISEAKFINTHDVDLNSAPRGAEGEEIGLSHYTSSYVLSNTSDADVIYRKNNNTVWPVYGDSTSPSVTPDGDEIWYATGFSVAPVMINRITVPIVDGNASEIEILCANGEQSGFDMASSFPSSPDKNADWNSVAIIKGQFNSGNYAVVDIPTPRISKYWMVKVRGVSSSAKLGRVQFALQDENNLSAVAKFSEVLFDSVHTDTDSDSTINLQVGLFDTIEFDGNEFSVEWESTSNLVDTETGAISSHENDETIKLTAIVSDPENPSVSYCVTKEYKLEGMLKIKIFKGAEKTPDTGVLNDGFYYTNHERTLIAEPNHASYHPEKFVHFNSVDSGFEFHWEKERSIKRLQLWAWPADSITDYEIQISDDGTVWTTHESGAFEDQYASDESARPTDDADESKNANFYPVIFNEATEPIKHIRFVIKGFRKPEKGTYIAEAYFHDTNDINYLAMGTIPGTETHNSYKARSRYVVSYYVSNTTDSDATMNRNSSPFWPVWSSSGQSPNLKASPDVPEYSFYATSFQGPPVLVNKASITVATGEAFEIEVKCAETLESGFKWGNYPPCPDTLAKYKTVARISGKFGKGTHTFNFDNDFKSKHWMIKITSATADFTFSGLGYYAVPTSEISSSSYAIDGIFDNVSDTALDNVIKDKFNLPGTIEKNGEIFNVSWNYDSSMVNSDGTIIPALEDREMVLKASVGSPDEAYKHVAVKTYYILGQDSSNRTSLCHEENIAITDASSITLDAGLDYGFSFDGKKEVEIDFNEAMSGGVIELVKGEDVALTVNREDNEIVFNKGTDKEARCEYAEKIKLDISGDQYSVAAYNGTYYKVMLYNKDFLSRKSFDTIELIGAEGVTLALDSIDVNVVSTSLFDSIEEQFVFGKISPDYRATNLNGDLTLIDKVGDITFAYETDDSGVIDLTTTPGKGIVDISSPAESYIKVTATGVAAGDTFTKTFKVLTGRNNLFGGAKSGSPASPLEGSNAVYAADGNLETEFVTSSSSYRINIDLQKVQAFSRLRIIEADSEAKIQKFKIEVSDDNTEFREIYNNSSDETPGIDSNALITVPYTETRFVRVTIISTTGSGTGIRDICAYNEMTDSEKLNSDMETLLEGLEIKNGTVIPKTGKFGTQFTLSSNASAVSIVETDDRAAWKIVTLSTSSEVNAEVTLNAVNATASAEPKKFSLIVLADTNIGDNVMSGAGSSGGGGSRNTSGSVPIVTEPAIESYTDNELSGHWGANEIKNLVRRGIVQGNGNSLNLTAHVTRAEFCKMIVVALGLELEPSKGTFFDISSNDWFSQYAETAFKNGIMSGDNNGFRGNDVISRQEMAVVLVKALQLKNHEINVETEISFTDNAEISSWAFDYVKLAAGINVLKGYDTGDFKPSNNLKRDEAMVVVYRLISELEK